jgi:hypothetical protein
MNMPCKICGTQWRTRPQALRSRTMPL